MKSAMAHNSIASLEALYCVLATRKTPYPMLSTSSTQVNSNTIENIKVDLDVKHQLVQATSDSRVAK